MSAWQLNLPGARLALTLSPTALRGFSGEGGLLFAPGSEHAEVRQRIEELLNHTSGLPADTLVWRDHFDPVTRRAAVPAEVRGPALRQAQGTDTLRERTRSGNGQAQGTDRPGERAR